MKLNIALSITLVIVIAVFNSYITMTNETLGFIQSDESLLKVNDLTVRDAVIYLVDSIRISILGE